MTKRPTRFRRVLRLAALASTAVFVLALAGYVIRDRTRWLAILMYLPMPLVAAATILVQTLAWERARWGRRLLVVIVALFAGLISIRAMRGVGAELTYAPPDALRVIQWNVQWGRNAEGWKQTAMEIEAAGAGVVVLSEAPSDEKLAGLCKRLGEDWTFDVIRNPPGSRYWFAIAVLSRNPSTLESQLTLPNGAGMMVRIDRADGPLRVFAVDGQSDPKIARTPMLAAVVAFCAAGPPVDIVAGDFNAVSRSVGFDALASQGYRLGATQGTGWRAAYPARFPLYDIDHVWVGPRHVATGCRLLDSPGTNHRGQVVTCVIAN